MELEEVIKIRRSIRKFSDKKLEEGILEKIISAGNCAPSHCNTQGWKFIFVDEKNVKEKIYESGGSFVIKNSPYGILVLYNVALSDNLEYRDYIQSSAAAIQNMLLTIHSLGLGACWVCHLPTKKILRKIFNIPKSYSPIAYVAFGYPKEEIREMPRKHKIDEILADNKFIWPREKTPIKVYLKRIFRKLYFILPIYIKKIIAPLANKFVKKFHN